MEKGDIGSGGADLGSVLNRHCSEREVTSIICRCTHNYTTLVRTFYKPYIRDRRAFASYTMAMLNTFMIQPHALLLMMVLRILNQAGHHDVNSVRPEYFALDVCSCRNELRSTIGSVGITSV